MEKEISSYEKQALDFLNKIGASMSVKFLRHGKYFDDDNDTRDIYEITFTRPDRYPFTLTFGQSVVHSGKFIVRDRGTHKFNDRKDASKKAFGAGSGIENNPEFSVPSAYDVLACITKYDPGDFEKDFCSEFGYDPDSRKAEKTYHAVVAEWQKVSAFFSPNEMQELQEIQ